jgi:hypothetical protein
LRMVTDTRFEAYYTWDWEAYKKDWIAIGG